LVYINTKNTSALCVLQQLVKINMDGVKVAQALLKNIRQRRDELTQSLVDGSIATMEDYRFITGQIRGLTWCEEEIRTSMKGIEDE